MLVLDALLDPVTTLGGLVTRIAVERAPQGLCTDAASESLFVKNFMSRSLTVLETDSLFHTGNKTVASSEIPTVSTEALPAAVFTGNKLEALLEVRHLRGMKSYLLYPD